MEQEVADSNPARFKFFNKYVLCFISEGRWLFNKKLQIIVISLPQDSFFCTFMFNTLINCKIGGQVGRAMWSCVGGNRFEFWINQVFSFSFVKNFRNQCKNKDQEIP